MKKKLALILSAVLSLTLLAGCSGNSKTADNGLMQEDVLVMSTEGGFPPFEYYDANNKLVGVDIDIANKVAEKMGVKLEIKDMEFTQAVSGVYNGQSDMVAAGMSITEERKKNIDFSTVYLEQSNLILKKKGDDKIKTVADLKDKVVGVQTGTTGDTWCQDNKDIKEVKQYGKFAQAIVDLKNGKIDCIVTDEVPVKSFAAQNKDTLEYIEEPCFTNQTAIGVKKGNEKLLKVINEVLAEMMENGELDKSFKKHEAAS